MAKILFCLLVYLKSDACPPPSYNKNQFHQKFENMRSACVEQCKVLARVKDAVPGRYWKTKGDKKTIVPSYREQYQFSPPSSIWMPCINLSTVIFHSCSLSFLRWSRVFYKKNLITCHCNLLTLRWKKLASLVLSTMANSRRFRLNYSNCYRKISKSDFFCVNENAKKN